MSAHGATSAYSACYKGGMGEEHPTYRELDVVAIPEDIPDAGIKAGDLGAVVDMTGGHLDGRRCGSRDRPHARRALPRPQRSSSPQDRWPLALERRVKGLSMASDVTYHELDEVRAPADVPEAGVKAGDLGVVLIELYNPDADPPHAIEAEYALPGLPYGPCVVYSPDLSRVLSHHRGYGP